MSNSQRGIQSVVIALGASTNVDTALESCVGIVMTFAPGLQRQVGHEGSHSMAVDLIPSQIVPTVGQDRSLESALVEGVVHRGPYPAMPVRCVG